jgi:energy-converting hydrogenase Eha subunit H
MKGLIITIALVAFLALLALSNPDADEYSDYLREELAREAGEEDELAGALMAIFGGLAESVLANASSRDNYVLFSIYTTNLDPDELVVLGILGNFIVLSES